MPTIKVSLTLDDLVILKNWYQWYREGTVGMLGIDPTDEDLALIGSINTILDGYKELYK